MQNRKQLASAADIPYPIGKKASQIPKRNARESLDIGNRPVDVVSEVWCVSFRAFVAWMNSNRRLWNLIVNVLESLKEVLQDRKTKNEDLLVFQDVGFERDPSLPTQPRNPNTSYQLYSPIPLQLLGDGTHLSKEICEVYGMTRDARPLLLVGKIGKISPCSSGAGLSNAKIVRKCEVRETWCSRSGSHSCLRRPDVLPVILYVASRSLPLFYDPAWLASRPQCSEPPPGLVMLSCNYHGSRNDIQWVTSL